MAVGIVGGCGKLFEDPTGPTEGPEGQPLEEYYGKDSEGNRIMYEFYLSGADTVKHGDYWVYYENGDESYWIEFREGKRHGWSISYSLTECDEEDSEGRWQCRTIIDKWDRDYYINDTCVNHNDVECEGDEYDGY